MAFILELNSYFRARAEYPSAASFVTDFAPSGQRSFKDARDPIIESYPVYRHEPADKDLPASGLIPCNVGGRSFKGFILHKPDNDETEEFYTIVGHQVQNDQQEGLLQLDKPIVNTGGKEFFYFVRRATPYHTGKLSAHLKIGLDSNKLVMKGTLPEDITDFFAYFYHEDTLMKITGHDIKTDVVTVSGDLSNIPTSSHNNFDILKYSKDNYIGLRHYSGRPFTHAEIELISLVIPTAFTNIWNFNNIYVSFGAHSQHQAPIITNNRHCRNSSFLCTIPETDLHCEARSNFIRLHGMGFRQVIAMDMRTPLIFEVRGEDGNILDTGPDNPFPLEPNPMRQIDAIFFVRPIY